MVFKRRKPLSTARRIRDFFYPPSGWRRAVEYFGHRLRRLPDTPHKIALGFACGVFVSFSPFFGFHFVYAGMVAMMVRGNVLASLLGTFVGNPVTFPFIATLSLGLGRRMLGLSVHDNTAHSLSDSFGGALSGLWQSILALFGLAPPALWKLEIFWREVFLPYYLGGLLPGLISAVAFYALSRPVIAAYQKRRRKKLLAGAKRGLQRKKKLKGQIPNET